MLICFCRIDPISITRIRSDVKCSKGFEGMTWDWSKVGDDDLFDESWLDDFHFGFGQLRQAIWKVEPEMKYLMLNTGKRSDLDD